MNDLKRMLIVAGSAGGDVLRDGNLFSVHLESVAGLLFSWRVPRLRRRRPARRIAESRAAPKIANQGLRFIQIGTDPWKSSWLSRACGTRSLIHHPIAQSMFRPRKVQLHRLISSHAGREPADFGVDAGCVESVYSSKIRVALPPGAPPERRESAPPHILSHYAL
jgi:hypothetical protein